MLLKQPMVDALNGQVVEEFGATAQYIAISLYFEDETLPELAKYFYAQAMEEHEHAMKLLRYISEAGNKPIVPGTKDPKNHFETAEEAVQFMHRREKRDLSFETTTTGPHRDRFILMHDGKEFSHIASTGQVRLCSLILRVAQANFFSSKTGKQPLLLLDDVLLELDAGKRERFIEELPECEQTFFTFLPDEQFRKYSDADTLIYRVVGGEFQREKSG